MARMIRKQIYIDERQEELLKAQASATGRAEADIIRGYINDALGRDEEAARREAAWDRLQAMWDEIAADGPGEGGPIRWTREEIHERHPG